MADWQAGDVATNGIRLHYTRTGGDRPALVLAHGVMDDGLCWTPLAELLAPDYDVIMVDARGHGRSDAPEQGYGPADQAADLAGLISGLELRRPAILGHSMGAATALVLAGLYPELPRAILLEDPPPWWMPPSQLAAEEQTAAVEQPASAAAETPAPRRKTRDEWLAEQRAATPGWSEAELQPWADAKMRFSANVRNLFRMDMLRTLDWSATLRQVRCPALLITGDRALGAIVEPHEAAALRALLPQLQIAQIAQAGHSIRRDQFARYVEIVRRFLADLPA